jgi:hypothetical protein
MFGLIGAVLNVCVAAAVGVCGPFVSLLAGGAAGYFAVQKEKGMVKGDGARMGATSGAIAGAVVLVGQLIGAVVALVFIQSSGTQPLFGSIPTTTDGSFQLAYYGGGLAFGFCIGLFGIGLAAVAGAATGYFGTSTGPEIIG